MNKRDFLKRLIAVGTVGLVTPPVAGSVPIQEVTWPDEDHPQIYHDYKLIWSRWVGSRDSSLLIGNWLAYPTPQKFANDRNPQYFYVSCPGFVGGPYRPGYTFNITQRGGRLCTSETSATVRDCWVHEGLQYLTQLIEIFGDTVPQDFLSLPLFDFPMDWNPMVYRRNELMALTRHAHR